jgi:hypothetical protein
MARRRNFEMGQGTKTFLSGDLAHQDGATVQLRPPEFVPHHTFDNLYMGDKSGATWADWSARREGKRDDENYQIPLFSYTPPVVDSLWSTGGDPLSAHHVLTMAAHKSLKDSGSLPTHSPSLSPYSAKLVAKAIDRGHVLPYPGKDSPTAHEQAKFYANMDPQELDEEKANHEAGAVQRYDDAAYNVIDYLDTKGEPATGNEPLLPYPDDIKEHSEDRVKQMHREVKAHIDKVAEAGKKPYVGKHIRTYNPDQLRVV